MDFTSSFSFSCSFFFSDIRIHLMLPCVRLSSHNFWWRTWEHLKSRIIHKLPRWPIKICITVVKLKFNLIFLAHKINKFPLSTRSFHQLEIIAHLSGFLFELKLLMVSMSVFFRRQRAMVYIFPWFLKIFFCTYLKMSHRAVQR